MATTGFDRQRALEVLLDLKQGRCSPLQALDRIDDIASDSRGRDRSPGGRDPNPGGRPATTGTEGD